MDKTQIKELVLRQKEFFESHATLDIEFRRAQLQKLIVAVTKNQDKIYAALKADLGKPELESLLSENGSVIEEAKYALKHLSSWMKPQKVSTPLLAQPGKSYIYPEPKGVVAVLSPWNYPISLALNPVVAALAAGNCVILKPSELAPACSKVLREIIEQNFKTEVFACVEGDATVATNLLKERFDHIFFTGSTQVGKKIMMAAAEHLTPVTLELGGKSPCIVDESASLDVAASRIVWGKFFNAGQTCVAPDYVLVHSKIYEKFLEKLKKRVRVELGEDPSLTPDYGRIINERHFDRLISYMNDGKLLCGGAFKKEEKYIAPTILADVELESKVMQEEIFGPILPVLPYSNLNEAKEIVRLHPNPLALYLFCEDDAVKEQVLREIPSGGVCINDTVIHLVPPELPFGGRGQSGVGAYHGEAGFDVFTHHKSVLQKTTLIDPPIRYRPYSKNMKTAKWLVG
jgi:aldehyde dehydrogenase (NAD+)